MKRWQGLRKPMGNFACRGLIRSKLQEKLMKTLAVLLLVLTSLAGCVAYPVPYDDGRSNRHHDGASQSRGDRDRDGDGVSNRDDRRPNNPYRY
jgi:hypothetical protein